MFDLFFLVYFVTFSVGFRLSVHLELVPDLYLKQNFAKHHTITIESILVSPFVTHSALAYVDD